jgi:hypothetical protein
LDTATLLKEASVYARDLFFTLNLTSRQERYQQQRVHVNGNKSTPQLLRYHHGPTPNNVTNSVRRTVSSIQSRKKKTILLSFGNIRAVAGLHDVILFDAHLPTVREFALELRTLFDSKRNNSFMESSTSIVCHNTHNHANINEPYELLFLESVLRDTVDSYHRRLRLFEPIGTYNNVGCFVFNRNFK